MGPGGTASSGKSDSVTVQVGDVSIVEPGYADSRCVHRVRTTVWSATESA